LATLEEQSEIITILEEYMSVISVFDRQVDKNLKRADRLRQATLKKPFPVNWYLKGIMMNP